MRSFSFVGMLFAALGMVSAVQAEMITVKTIELCQQEEGDQWVEIGIVKNTDQSLEAIVVEHDADEPGRIALLTKRKVDAYNSGFDIEYTDREPAQLWLRVVPSRNPRATLWIQNSPFVSQPKVRQNRRWEDLNCYGPNEITYPKQR